MAELLAKQPLFSGKTEIEQLDKVTLVSSYLRLFSKNISSVCPLIYLCLVKMTADFQDSWHAERENVDRILQLTWSQI